MSILDPSELRFPSVLQLTPLAVPLAAFVVGIVALGTDNWSGRLPLEWAVVAALGLGAFVSLSLVGWAIDALWYLVGRSDAARHPAQSTGESQTDSLPLERRMGWLAKLLGLAELAIYFMALATSQFAFAAGWLAIKTTGKVVSEWNQYASPRHGRQVFNIYLLGTALSAFNAAATFGLAGWLASGDPTRLR